MVFPTSLRGQIGVLGLLLVVVSVAGEIAAVWRWTAIPGYQEAAEKEFKAAVGRASVGINMVGSLRESNGTYYKMVPGRGGNPALYEITELTQLRKSIDARAEELDNERLTLPPLMLGLVIPLALGVALYLWGKDEPE